ncbi:AP2-associated protein kinase [Trichinella spiralis]|uniref:AP2-associated protein kinase n=1 Tax=Trichinella spiralis TaxID=6334 RepID=A0ABR3L1C3_TRISP
MWQPGKKKIIPFDTERKSLEHRIQRLQRLCDNESELVAIRDAINAVDEGKKAFINSRRARQEEPHGSERAKTLAGYDQLLDLVTLLQSKANDLLKELQPAASSQNTATLHQGECVPLSAIVQIPKLPTFSGDILEFKAIWGQFDDAVHRSRGGSLNSSVSRFPQTPPPFL